MGYFTALLTAYLPKAEMNVDLGMKYEEVLQDLGHVLSYVVPQMRTEKELAEEKQEQLSEELTELEGLIQSATLLYDRVRKQVEYSPHEHYLHPIDIEISSYPRIISWCEICQSVLPTMNPIETASMMEEVVGDVGITGALKAGKQVSFDDIKDLALKYKEIMDTEGRWMRDQKSMMAEVISELPPIEEDISQDFG